MWQVYYRRFDLPMPNGPANSKKGKQASHKSRKRHQGGVTATTIPLSTSATEPNQESVKVGQEEVKEDGLGEKFCHICAELMEKKWFAVAQCNHWTCHACALRLRVLYKKTECTFCKVGPIYSKCASTNDALRRRALSLS